jgi:phage recombination protein Bet
MSEEQKGMIEYTTMTGEHLQLSKSIIKQYLVSGDADKVTDQEVMMFMSLCKFQKLNPFLREAYLIKYGNSAATIVTGKETFLKRAAKNPKYRGHKTGISDDGLIAWAEVYVEGYECPIRCEVDYEEYVGRKRDGSVTAMWKTKRRTMLKKVALVQALREAFPEDFGGMYSEEEINEHSASEPIDMTPEARTAEPQRKSDKAKKEEPIDVTPKETKKPEGTKKAEGMATQSQIKMIFAKLKRADILEEDFKAYMGIESMNDLKIELVNDALKSIDEGKIKKKGE